jgi:hypothetical protein
MSSGNAGAHGSGDETVSSSAGFLNDANSEPGYIEASSKRPDGCARFDARFDIDIDS